LCVSVSALAEKGENAITMMQHHKPTPRFIPPPLPILNGFIIDKTLQFVIQIERKVNPFMREYRLNIDQTFIVAMHIPSNLKYTDSHLWVKDEGNDRVTTGITDHAQEMLGDIVYIEAPQVGTILHSGEPCGVVESVKTASDINAPLSGIVETINTEISATPECVNESPYDAWFFRLHTDNRSELENLMDAEGYRKFLAEN
jgi:glycine cleavage system H protein